MEEVAGLAALGSLIGFALVKAYSGKVLTQLRAECSRLITQERHLRQQKEHEESQLEVAEARLEQLETDKSGLEKDVDTLSTEVTRVDSELRRLKGDGHDEGDGDGDGQAGGSDRQEGDEYAGDRDPIDD